MSLLIFGLGAAALLRAAHESFASNSSWRAAPDVPFAQRPDTTMPVLAALRIETTPTEKANEQPLIAAAPADQPQPPAEPARNDQVAALRTVEPTPAEVAKPAAPPAPAPLAENPPAPEAASTPPASAPLASSPPASAPEAAAPADERKITTAAVADTASVKTDLAKSEPPPQAEPPAVPAASQPIATSETAAAPVADPADSLAMTRIATLGGPPVDIVEAVPTPHTVKLPRPRPDQSAIKKRAQARRALQRRRFALRARLMLQQQQANPFGQPQSFAPATAAAPRQ